MVRQIEIYKMKRKSKEYSDFEESKERQNDHLILHMLNTMHLEFWLVVLADL